MFEEEDYDDPSWDLTDEYEDDERIEKWEHAS